MLPRSQHVCIKSWKQIINKVIYKNSALYDILSSNSYFERDWLDFVYNSFYPEPIYFLGAKFHGLWKFSPDERYEEDLSANVLSCCSVLIICSYFTVAETVSYQNTDRMRSI